MTNASNENIETLKRKTQVLLFDKKHFSQFFIIENLYFAAVSYILILKKLRQSSDSLGATSRSNNSHSLRRRVTRMVIALVVCFSVCWFPYQVHSILLIPGGIEIGL